MSGRSFISIFIVVLGGACVDRLFIDVGGTAVFPIVVDGFISDQPGPYKVRVTKAFDIESKNSIRMPLSVKKMVLSDDQGHLETLSETELGSYQTSPDGMQGTPGRAYKLRIELLDGRIYESVPDTILATSGRVERVYHQFSEGADENGATTYGFDVFFDAVSGERNRDHLLWKFTGTFRSDTHPEQRDIVYHALPCVKGKCNYYDVCSGIVNIGGNVLTQAVFVQEFPCACCTCWYDLFNPLPLLNDARFESSGRYAAVKAYRVPLDQWIFMYKIYVNVSQLNLTRQTYDFWKSIVAQKNAGGSLFQPITGKIPNYFVQITGQESSMVGLFYAAAIRSNAIFITRADVPNPGIIPEVEKPWQESCLTLFPNSTTTRPSFWVD